MGDSPSPTILRAHLGALLRQLAVDAGRSPRDVAEYLGVSPSTVSKIYNGRQAVKVSQVRSIARLCGSDREEELVDLARRASEPGWWVEYGDIVPEWLKQLLGLEGAASESRTYQAELVPGPEQLPTYTERITRSARPTATDDEIRRLVDFRQARRLHQPPRRRIILNEAVLCRPVGTREDWREQLDHLVQLGDQPDVTLQVLPFSTGEHPVMGSSFKVLTFDREPGLDTVYLENDRAGGLLKSASEIRRYIAVFDQLARDAASPDDSREMLVKVASHL